MKTLAIIGVLLASVLSAVEEWVFTEEKLLLKNIEEIKIIGIMEKPKIFFIKEGDVFMNPASPVKINPDTIIKNFALDGIEVIFWEMDVHLYCVVWCGSNIKDTSFVNIYYAEIPDTTEQIQIWKINPTQDAYYSSPTIVPYYGGVSVVYEKNEAGEYKICARNKSLEGTVWSGEYEISLSQTSMNRYPEGIKGIFMTIPGMYTPGIVVWEMFDGNDWEIMMAELMGDSIDTIYKVTDNNTDDIRAIPWQSLFGSQKGIVWRAFDGNDYEIYHMELGKTNVDTITNNSVDDENPTVNWGYIINQDTLITLHVVWEALMPNSFEIMHSAKTLDEKWSSPQVINIPNEVNDINPSIGVVKGNLYDSVMVRVVWEREDEGKDAYYVDGKLLGINEAQVVTTKSIRVFPNPCRDFVMFIFPEAQNFYIYDISGRIIKKGFAKEYRWFIQRSAGIYFLKCKNKVFKIVTIKGRQNAP